MEKRVARSGIGVSVWHRCEQLLSEELPSRDYDSWIRPLQAESDQGELLLLAPNRYVKEEVESRYLRQIEELVANFGESSEVRSVRVVIGRWEHELGAPLRAAPHVTRVGERAASAASAESNGAAWAANASGSSTPVAEHSSRTVKAGLNESYVFDNFIAGKSNDIAKSTAMHVAARCQDGTAKVEYNPLLLYGSVGLGKTHLMHAVGNEVLSKATDVHVMYLPSERFGNDIVRGIRTHTIQEVTQRYRSVDVLLIDDIQFFAEKTGFQEELFHVFDAVLGRGSQVVLTSDRYPTEINGLESRLQSRFVGGFTHELDMPELETRVAILQNKGAAAGIDIPDDVAFYIAERIRSNVRELEGALSRVIASATHHGVPVTLELVRLALRGLFAIHARRITIDHIQRTVADYYRIKHSDMLARGRRTNIARPRQIAMCLAKELTNHSLPAIGEQFGGRDHTTVLYACRKVAQLRETTTDIAEDYRNLTRLLNS